MVNAAYRQDDRATTCDGAVHVAAAAAATGSAAGAALDGRGLRRREGRPYTEADEPTPLTDYGRAKADAERGVLAACPAALVVRTSLIYGGDRPGPQERLAADPEAAFFSDEVRCPIQVGDLADALIELAATERSGLLHVAGADRRQPRRVRGAAGGAGRCARRPSRDPAWSGRATARSRSSRRAEPAAHAAARGA